VEAERKHVGSGGTSSNEESEEESEKALDARVEKEWKSLASKGATDAVVSQDPRARRIVEGFAM